MDELALTERLIGYDTSSPEGIKKAAGFVKGWLESRDIPVAEHDVLGLPALVAPIGPESGPTVVFHGHLDVVPAHERQFTPTIDGDRLYGRGAYDMKGGLAAMMGAVQELREQQDVRILFEIVSDEESEQEQERATARLIAEGYMADFAITGEPTDLHIGVEAKGVLAMRLEVEGRAAHGATPWLGDNAVLKAIDIFRSIESLPFARESSDLFDRPSINLGRILGGDALNKVPDACVIDLDVRYLPEQDPKDIRDQVEDLADVRLIDHFIRAPVTVDRNEPHVGVLTEAVSPLHDTAAISVGRDGASEAISFIAAGIPAVEFGPVGGGHHGPEEWVSIESLASYKQALIDFVLLIPQRLSGSRRLRIA